MILVSYYWQLSCRYFQKMSSNSPLSTWIHRLNIPQLHLRCSLVLSSGWCGRVVWSALMYPVIVTGVSHNVTPSSIYTGPWHIASLGTQPHSSSAQLTHITLKIRSTDVELMHPVIEFSISLMTPLVQVSKSQLTIYELGTICKCAKLKLMADLHGDTVGNIRSGDTEGHIKT